MPGHPFRRFAIVAGQQNQPVDAAPAQLLHGGNRVRLQRVGDRHAAEVTCAFSQVDKRPLRTDFRNRDSGFLEQQTAAGPDFRTVHSRPDSSPGDLLGRTDAAGIDRSRPGFAQRGRDRMARAELRMRSELKQPVRIGPCRREHFAHFEPALRQRAGFIERNRFDAGQRLEVVAAFEQDAAARRPADSGEERKRHRDHQRARAGDHEKDQRAVNPDTPRRTGEKRRKHGEQNRRAENRRCVDSGETGDEVFALRLAPESG